MDAVQANINWHSNLPIFASEPFLKAVSDEYGWIGGVDKDGNLRCILPYTIIRKFNIRMVRFRVETICLDSDFDVDMEKRFLNNVVSLFKDMRVDAIIPATTNTIFRTVPDGADVAPYGSFIIDLGKSEGQLWQNIKRIYRQNINTAKKQGVEIKLNSNDLKGAYQLILETFQRSNLPFMDLMAFEKYIGGLGDYGMLMTAEQNGITQSCSVFAFSSYCAYAVYAGNVSNQVQGANKLLYWEAIRHFQKMGVKEYDFVGARINPEIGSKQAALSSFKRRFGANLKQGYIWRYSLTPFKYIIYRIAVKLRSGGDIVDFERHKINIL